MPFQPSKSLPPVGNFVLLAGAGTLARALSKGMGRPCFRVVQTYFAAANNVGDVAAKEEVWEVVGQVRVDRLRFDCWCGVVITCYLLRASSGCHTRDFGRW